MIERGLRNALATLADALDETPGPRPQQFRLEGRPESREERERQSEEQIEQSSVPEKERQVHRRVDAGPSPVRQLQGAEALRNQLRNRNNIRRAILISEVLDQPRALRPYRQDST